VATLVLLRHGESEWNARNLFTGWVDVDLTSAGEAEGRRAGTLLAGHGLLPDVAHTSVLTRAVRTGSLALDACARSWVPVRRSWRLNERHYGALQGLDKKETLARHGEEQFQRWRRSYDTAPPPLAPGSEFDVAADPRYAGLDPALLPRTECLRDVVARLLPYWQDALVPDLRAGRVVLVVAHGNSVRALVKYLDGLDDAAIAELNIPTGNPLVYHLDDALRPAGAAAYLDPQAAAAGAAAVAAQGRA
jgi:2,3-bisphosphoglycerate-dependent phosphoglycerate mutase